MYVPAVVNYKKDTDFGKDKAGLHQGVSVLKFSGRGNINTESTFSNLTQGKNVGIMPRERQ